MVKSEKKRRAPADLYITPELDHRRSTAPNHRQETLAVHELAARMADKPDDVLPRFVGLAMEITEGVSAGISLYEEEPAPGVFRWRYLQGDLSPFDGVLTPRNFSPCGVTLDENGPVLSSHPERFYDWIADAGLIIPEVLLVPLYSQSVQPLGTLWIVSGSEGHFTRNDARATSELASFVSIALRMLDAEHRLEAALVEQEMLAKEMSHRVKNLFAITDGLIRVGARSARDVRTFANDLSGRLHALASAHSLVGRNLRDVGAQPRTRDIGSLIRAIVEPHQHGEGVTARRVRAEGPIVSCGSHAINAIALVFHELATNAAKYGALSVADGSVDTVWGLSGEDLVLRWVEHGGPAVYGAPTQDSFGAALVRNTVTGQLGGALSYEWAREGLRVAMTVPKSGLMH